MIMLNLVIPQKIGSQESEHDCVDEWFPLSTRPHSF